MEGGIERTSNGEMTCHDLSGIERTSNGEMTCHDLSPEK